MTTLVTGATGNVGRNVVDELVRAGEEVRALTRHPEAAHLPAQAKVFRGDLARPETLADALDGADRMYLFPVPETAREVVALAREAGVRRVVVLSSGSVEAGLSDDFNLPVERAAEESGLEWTHLRPGEFMMNALYLWGPPVRAERVVRWPVADLAGVPIHEADIAAVAAVALLEDGHAGRAYPMTGPEKITPREQIRAIAAAIGQDIRFEVVTRERAREFVNWQDPATAGIAEFVLEFDPEDGLGYSAEEWAQALQPLDTVEQVTGHPARTFADWAHDHVRDFL
ncbi:NAD(P)H-binding protein [Streptomyces sp. HC44]|uniref:NAD(P)H-binding protein n=1 Tax=Streptomyces scabichelini TaxID=2711217 RepID=A0A6G4VNF5_9ACTN|nr:NAD(P)H-binding protein [Streptomyces scabichelini]NGO15314.1 NAD(P)H-binding protein [Streptomyces scabichelini]